MRFEFGDHVLDSATHELTRAGRVVALSPKAFELLATLLTHRPRALSKEELHRAVWPDTFVSDSSLARLVSELRAALGDQAPASRFVRTVHGFGYAFQGEASETRSDGSPPAPKCWLSRGRQLVPLSEGENLIGRSPDSIVVIDTAKVSRRHSRIVVRAGRATLEDLDSKNGTFLEGARLERATHLVDGHQITVGDLVMTFHSGSDLSTETELSMGKPGS